MRRGIVLLIALGLLAGRAVSAPAADAPLADAHIHYSAPDWNVYTPDQVVAILDKAGITRALVSSTPDDGTLKLYDRDPKQTHDTPTSQTRVAIRLLVRFTLGRSDDRSQRQISVPRQCPI